MGFDELWDGFEKIKTRTEDGTNFTYAVIKYFTKRHEIETKYSRNLAALHAECFKTEEIGTLQDSWLSLKEETLSLSDKRQTFCTELEALINVMNNNLKEDKKNRATLVIKGEKLVSDLGKTEEAMKKARAKYVDARKRQDRAQEAVQKAKATGSSVAKFQKAAEKDERKADKADNEYRISVNNLKVAQDKFYDMDMPALLREFEQLEEKRVNVTKDYFNQFVEKQNPVGPHWIESNDRILGKLRQINARSDIDLYVENNRPDSDQPPPRAQYISYDGSVVQDVNPSGGSSGGGSAPIAPAKKPKKESLMDKISKKRKDEPTAAPPAKPPPSVPSVPPPVSSPTTPPPAGHRDSSEDGRTATSPHAPLKQLVAVYSYDATEDNEISFLEGDTIMLLEKDDSGWWKGRNTKGQEGLFPSNFVEVVGEEGASGLIEINKDFKALYDYEAEDETELTIKEGEILHVQSETDGWYFGTNTQGKEGNFPSNFVEPIDKQNNGN